MGQIVISSGADGPHSMATPLDIIVSLVNWSLTQVTFSTGDNDVRQALRKIRGACDQVSLQSSYGAKQSLIM